MQSLRIVPHLRSSVVEEMPPGQVLLHTSRRADADAALVEGRVDVRPFTWGELLRVTRRRDLELVEVAEPLWLAEWVRAVRVLLVVRLVRCVLPGRAPVTTATYAIENVDPGERVSFPSLAARPRLRRVVERAALRALGVSLRLLDVVVFGTSGARDTYRAVFARPLRRIRHAVLPPRIDTCGVCGSVPADAVREPVVLFLGTPSARKGFDVLVDAWTACGAADRGWHLVVADPAGTEVPYLPAGVSIRVGVPRDEVHALLRRSAVVAMPSVRRPGWREQIGLPLVEGLAHGARVVTTTETGLADDVRDHPRVALTEPGDVASLADGLRRAMDATPAADHGDYRGHTKTDIHRWWLDTAVSAPPVAASPVPPPPPSVPLVGGAG